MNQNIEYQARLWAILCHLAAVIWLPICLISTVFFNIPVYIPFINILLTLFIWKSHKSRYPWIDNHGKESLNFQISLTVYIVIYIIVVLLLFPSCGVNVSQIPAANTVARWKFNYYLGLAFIPIGVTFLYQLISCIAAAIQAYRGKTYRYASAIRFLR
ncbi:DUF4870 domain-containing protein [Nostoc sp. LEGE 06077]|uniref:DUF4870 domain-containing protein n=1 Tax=Nostoc sp. LEGE 06077 TaxID=915325 RepID=UPI001882D5E7|nr:DUF4870 domain-containing protein [Nostoc sp. LEGE 06077]MBE9208770.1 DUF4870 domain-containing protein [Nostoc sp. LEGE 06077]